MPNSTKNTLTPPTHENELASMLPDSDFWAQNAESSENAPFKEELLRLLRELFQNTPASVKLGVLAILSQTVMAGLCVKIGSSTGLFCAMFNVVFTVLIVLMFDAYTKSASCVTEKIDENSRA